MRIIARFLLSTVLVVCLILFTLSLSLNQYLYPNIYINALEKNNLYEYLEQQGIDSQLTLTTFTQEGVKPTIDRVLSELLSYIRSDTNNPEVIIHINSTALRVFFEDQAAQLPACERDEDPFIDENVSCRPADMSVSEFLNRTLEKQNRSDILRKSEVNLLDIYDKEKNIEKARSYVKVYSILLYILPLISLAIILTFWLISKKEIRSTLRWLSIPFILTAFAIFAIYLSLFRTMQTEVYQLEGITPPFDSFIIDLFTPFTTSLLIYGIILFSIALLLLILSFIIKKREVVQRA